MLLPISGGTACAEYSVAWSRSLYLQAEYDMLKQQAKRSDIKAREELEAATAASLAARVDCEKLAGDAEELRVRLSVLLETIETLQAGEPGEREQRVVSLTCQLTAAQSKEIVIETRVKGWKVTMHTGNVVQCICCFRSTIVHIFNCWFMQCSCCQSSTLNSSPGKLILNNNNNNNNNNNSY